MFTTPKRTNEYKISPEESKVLAAALNSLTNDLFMMGYVRSRRFPLNNLPADDIRLHHALKPREQLADEMHKSAEYQRILTLMLQSAPITIAQREALSQIPSIRAIVTNYPNVVAEYKLSR